MRWLSAMDIVENRCAHHAAIIKKDYRYGMGTAIKNQGRLRYGAARELQSDASLGPRHLGRFT